MPSDMTACGFDEIDLGRPDIFKLTTRRQPFAEMVDALIDILDAPSAAEDSAVA
jgi:DNA-binding LacI/PurR family transcriptional regulator